MLTGLLGYSFLFTGIYTINRTQPREGGKMSENSQAFEKQISALLSFVALAVAIGLFVKHL